MMRLCVVALFVLGVGCGPEIVVPAKAATGARATATRADAEPDTWRRRSPDSSCHDNLAALATAQLDGYRGLPRCGRVDAESALGSSGDTPSKFEQFGEYRVYPRPEGSILVWFLADDIRVMQLIYPKLRQPITSLLGKPEATVKSQLSTDWDQFVYASRGLTAHVKRGTQEVVALFVYRPTTVAAFLETDIARVAKSESPMEELK